MAGRGSRFPSQTAALAFFVLLTLQLQGSVSYSWNVFSDVLNRGQSVGDGAAAARWNNPDRSIHGRYKSKALQGRLEESQAEFEENTARNEDDESLLPIGMCNYIVLGRDSSSTLNVWI